MNETATNPALGIIIFALGGLAGAVFYLPFKKVKNWAWESYWLVYALFGLVIAPWALALTTSPNLVPVLKAASGKDLFQCYICGAMWGLGGLTWGLMIRYLGVGLGLAIGCGLCSATGTLIPTMIKGEFGKLAETSSGLCSLVGVGVSLFGIIAVGLAGMSKEKELPEEEKKKAVAEFDFKKGILVAVFSGIMSAGMNFGLNGTGAKTIQDMASTINPVTPSAWQGMPVLVVVLLGGFTVNFLWCLFLNFKNKTTGDYFKGNTPLLMNLIFAGLAGMIWCMQFVCQKTGEPAMGKMAYVGWAVLMACAILFGTLLGVFLGEWKGTGSKTRTYLSVGLALLVVSAVVSGYSGYLDLNSKKTATPPAGTEAVMHAPTTNAQSR
jgi:L-rhamnose-H+ transport protein